MLRKLLSLLMALALTLPASVAAGDDKDKKNKNDRKDVEKIGDRDVGKGMNWYSLEKEIAIGKSLAQQVEAQSKVVDDPVVSEYVNRVGQNVVRNSDARVPFTIKVIDDDSINAFALPGGFFFVNSGLILEADEEAELAGVMAHEIAHVAARHGTRQATRGELANLLSIPLIFVGGGIGFGARQAAGLLVPMTFMKFSRNFEREADELGLQYMYKTGYDPQAFVTFFEKIQAKEKKRPGTLAKAFSSHPQTPERIEASQKEIAQVLPARGEHIVTTSEFDEVKARLQMLQNRRKADDRNRGDRPTLRRTTTASSSDDKTDKSDKTAKEGKTAEEEDKRPTLKRREN
jgi:beta-barrel assembly-enhancing protease